MQEIVVATGNAGKLRELNELLEPIGWHAQPQSAFGVTGPEETGLTFVENALLKARH
ncbi:MAG TPA: non-canonical purine NTP pyrophosphatase, partial [Gammaproteobacteria bacterium]|nr:non-canonical purine NTP pyrophosphatase [Gammaproteobacteria bacterium]